MHTALYFFYNLTKNFHSFHRAAAFIILHLEIPLIRALLKQRLKGKLLFIVPRHSIIEKGSFNLFMSDIDLSIVINNEADLENMLSEYLDLKKIFLNLGEPAIYREEEWASLVGLQADELDNVWQSLFQLRKIKWNETNKPQLVSKYQALKLDRARTKSLKILNSSNGYLIAENFLPFLRDIPDEKIEYQYPKLDEYTGYSIEIAPDATQGSLIFKNTNQAAFFESICPTANSILPLPQEKIRLYLLKRELLMSTYYLRLLKYSSSQSEFTKIKEWIRILMNKVRVAENKMDNRSIEVVLKSNNNEKLSIYFNLLKTDIASKYFEILKKSIERGDPIYEPDRTYNFPGDERDNNWIATELNQCIDTINSYSHVIYHKAQPKMDQQLMNELHKYFEIYRGPILNPPDFFKNAPLQIKKALEEFNILIHRYEDYNRNVESIKNGERPAAKIIVTYAKERVLLSDEDFNQFTTQIKFGRYYLNYNEVGKPIWDMYQDNDEVVGEENIVPLKYYSADALIEFSPSTSYEAVDRSLKKFYQWWDQNEDLMSSLGFKKHDPRNAIGHIPLADLDRNRGPIEGLDELEIINLIGKYPIISHLNLGYSLDS